MKLFLFFGLFVMAMSSFAQPKQSTINIAEAEKKGGAIKILGDAGIYTSASSNFTTSYARCRWSIDPSLFYISGSVTYYINLTKDAKQIVFDLDNVLLVDSVVMHNTNIDFTQKDDKTLTLNFPQTKKSGQQDSLAIYYHGTPANTGNGSFTKRIHNSDIPVLWTLSEPYGARDWWPCRNGLDDKIDSIDIYITHPSVYSASANGLLLDSLVDNNTTTSHFKHRYPIATYLVGIAVTNYITFTKQLSLQKGVLPVTTTVYPEYETYFQTYVTPVYDALLLYDQYFGAYPFMNERYGQTEFDWTGGMEHQSNSFITNAEEYLMAHELAHQWFGDKITLGSWQDTWLNEGFATYLADLFYTEHYHPENLAAIVSQDMNMATSEPSGSVWVEDTTNINRIFSDNLTYKKGAMLLRMLRWTLGDSLFFKGMNLYQQDAALQYNFARTKDFQRNMEATGGKSLDTFFTQWFYGKGYPSFNIKWNWKNNKIQLQVTETASDTSNTLFTVPLQLVFANASQSDTTVINIQKNISNITLPLSFNPDSVLIDPSQFIITKNNNSAKDTMLTIVEETPISNELILYPNPANTVLHIKLKTSDSATFAVINIISSSGAFVYKKTFTSISQNALTVPVSQLAKGVYFVLIQNNKGIINKKKFIRQ